MSSSTFAKLSGLMLCLSGTVYIADTGLDTFAPHLSPGLGALVPLCGLVGFPGFWLSLRTQTGLALAAYGMGILGLAGLVVVTFLGNRLFADLPPQITGQIITATGPELATIGGIFLISALLLLPVCWTAGGINRLGAGLYAIGAIPVSLPPLMPDWLVTTGGIAVATGLLCWGAGLLRGEGLHSRP
ncbi:MAG: hypothetical protein ACK5IB_11785 [Qingshengfaniella sp.]